MKQGTMSMNHNILLAITATMPCKTIEINDEPYLERYFAHMLADGTQIWYHRFLRNDPERHLHTHPWFARSTILVGGYVEDRDVDGRVVRASYSAHDTNAIGFCTLHRIVEVEPDTWTMMIVSPGRQPHWHFVEEDGSRTEMPTSPFEWHQDFKPRADAQPVDADALSNFIRKIDGNHSLGTCILAEKICEWIGAQAAQQRGIVEKYNELLYHVARKNPNESRHETALRYIKNAESVESYCAAAKEEL